MEHQNLNRLAITATLHCLTGCAIGEILGNVIGSSLGWSTQATEALAMPSCTNIINFDSPAPLLYYV